MFCACFLQRVREWGLVAALIVLTGCAATSGRDVADRKLDRVVDAWAANESVETVLERFAKEAGVNMVVE
jgi:hypothetical protein